MAKLTRVQQKILGGGSVNNGQFGSARAGTYLTTTNAATIQALSAWEAGWFDALVSGDLLPTVEERQGVDYVITRQLAYLMQEGVAEYDSTTTYYINSWVKESGTNKLYKSLVDDNVGNALSDGTKWELLLDFDTIPSSFGTIAAQDADAVSITGGNIAGITDLAIADGGTGASTAAAARTNLGVKNPTTQYLTSGTAATYTTPAGATKLFIRMVGGGGGGGAANGTPTVGSAGGDTSFNSIVAKGGGGGSIGPQAVGGGGGASGTGTAKIRIAGENGGRYFTNGNYTVPSAGGRSVFGGNGSAPNPGAASVGISAAVNSGSGGSGATSGSSAGGGGGGGAGEYVEFEITTPSASYTYTVGAGGARGTGDQGGGDGGSGLIIVTEYYN